MNKIQMVDLQRQYAAIKPQIDEAIQNVIDQTQFIKGPQVRAFEQHLKQYLEVNHCISCGNGTDALQIALMALQLPSHAEVILPAFTYIATIEVIALLGLTPILVDVNPDTYNIDVTQIETAITPNTKVILPVHLYGQGADMDAIVEIAKQHNLYIIEDNAQGLGGSVMIKGVEKKLGTIGHIGCTSFFPSKNLGCYGDGGALFTNDDALAARISMIANHGQSKKYYHEIVGCNSRLDSIQAAILNVKLPYLNQYNEARNKVAEYYNEALKNISQITLPTSVGFAQHVYHQYTIKLKDEATRNQLQSFLQSKEIPTMIYYPLPVHHQPVMQDLIDNKFVFPVAEKLSKVVLSLPIHTEMDEEQLNYICNNIKIFFE